MCVVVVEWGGGGVAVEHYITIIKVSSLLSIRPFYLDLCTISVCL